MSIKAEVESAKRLLIKKAKSKGLYENFGDSEVTKLEDKYREYLYGTPDQRPEYRIIQEFGDWCVNLDINQLNNL